MRIYSAILLLLLSCQGTEPNKLDGQNDGSLKTQDDSFSQASLPEQGLPIFDKDIEFEITESKASASYPSSAPDTIMCKGWSLTGIAAKRVIKGFEPIDGHLWHYKYDHLPCVVEGQLSQNGKDYKFSINAGSWLTITSKDTTLYFGDEEKEFEKHFMSSVWTEEDDKK